MKRLLGIFLLSLLTISEAPAAAESTPSIAARQWRESANTTLGTPMFEAEFTSPKMISDDFQLRDFWDGHDGLPNILIALLEAELASPLDPASSVAAWPHGIIDDTLRRQVLNAYFAELIGFRERHNTRNQDLIREPDSPGQGYRHDTFNFYGEQPGVGRFLMTRGDEKNIALIKAYAPPAFFDLLFIASADLRPKLATLKRLEADRTFIAQCVRQVIMGSLLPLPDIYASRGDEIMTFGPYSPKQGYAIAETIRAADRSSARPGLAADETKDPLSVNVLVTMAVARLLCWQELGIPSREQALREHVTMLMQAAHEGAQNAVPVLRYTMQKEILSRHGQWADLARDPLLRRLTTLYLEPNHNQFYEKAAGVWLDELARTGTHDDPFCLRLAVRLEQTSHPELSKRALEMCPGDHPEAHYLRSRLCAGDLSEKLSHLQAALQATEKNMAEKAPATTNISDYYDSRHAYPFGINEAAERAVLIRLEYVDALLKAGHFPDACRAARKLPEQLDVIYIADVLLSIDQLREVAEETCPADYDVEMYRERPVIKISDDHHSNEIALRMILARRLFQANRYEEACRYLPKQFKEGGMAYAKWMGMADDISHSMPERGRAMRKAATVLSENREIWCTTGGYGWYFGWERIPHYQKRRDTSRFSEDEPPRVETERIESAESRITPDFANNRNQIGMLCLQASFMLPKEEAAEALVFGYGQASRFYPAIANVMRNRLLTDFSGTEAAKLFFTPETPSR